MSDFNLSEAQKIIVELQIARKELTQANETITQSLSLLQKQTKKIEILVNTVKLIDASVLTKKIQKIENSKKENANILVLSLKIFASIALVSFLFFYFYFKN